MYNIVEFPKLGIKLNVLSTIEIGNLSISLYGILIALGLVLAMIYAFKNFKNYGINSDKAIDAIIGGIIGGIVGARLYYILFSLEDYKLEFDSWENFWETFSRLFKTWEGGMAIYGGIIGALLVGVFILKKKKMKVWPMLDVVGLGFLIGQAVGRWGNFVNVEAFGDNTTLPWGMTGPRVVSYLRSQVSVLGEIGVNIDPTLPVHPCFLYESLWCIIGFIALHLYSKHRRFDGEIFLMYVGWYGLGRFFIEGFRTDSLMIGNLRVSQLLALFIVIASIASLFTVYSKIKRANDPTYMPLYINTPEGQEELKPLEPKKKKNKSQSNDDAIENIEATSNDNGYEEEIAEHENEQTTQDTEIVENEDQNKDE